MRIAVCLFAACSVLFGGGLEIPSAGLVRLPDGRISRVLGVAGAFVLDPVDGLGADRAAFSGKLLVSKNGGTVRVLDANLSPISESDAAQGTAVFGFSPDGTRAVAAYPGDGRVSVFRGTEWGDVPIDGSGVNSVALAADDSLWLIRDEDGELIIERRRISDGGIELRAPLGATSAPALVLPDGSCLFVRGDAVLFRGARGSEHRLDTASDLTNFNIMGPSWIEAGTRSGRTYAIRTGPRIQVYELPGVSQ